VKTVRFPSKVKNQFVREAIYTMPGYKLLQFHLPRNRELVVLSEIEIKKGSPTGSGGNGSCQPSKLLP
jgi:hypothetical protein